MGTIKKAGNLISGSVSVFIYKDLSYPDGDMYIAYCPSLDLVGYDRTQKKAKADFEWVLKDYLQDQLNNDTLNADLREHGWHLLNDSSEEPELRDLLGKDTQLQSVVKQEYRKVDVSTSCLAPA